MNVYSSNHLIRQEKVKIYLAPLFFYVGSGSGMTRKAGSGINIPDPQH
jgi:hypothetical protein